MMRLITTVSRVTFQLLWYSCTQSWHVHWQLSHPPCRWAQDWAEVPAPKQLPDHSIYEQDNQCGQHRTKSKDSKRDTPKRGIKEVVISSTSHWRKDIRQDSNGNRSAKMQARKVWHTQGVAMKNNPMKDGLGNQRQWGSHLLWSNSKNPLQPLGWTVPNRRVASRVQRKSLWLMVEDEAVTTTTDDLTGDSPPSAFRLSVVWYFHCVLTNTTYLQSEGKGSH